MIVKNKVTVGDALYPSFAPSIRLTGVAACYVPVHVGDGAMAASLRLRDFRSSVGSTLPHRISPTGTSASIPSPPGSLDALDAGA
jgi:hypothetical protein